MKKNSFLLISHLRKLHLSKLKYICCILLALSSCFAGKTQIHFVANQPAHFAAVGSTNELGFIITDLNIIANLTNGFEFHVEVNTDELDEGGIYKLFSVGYYRPSNENAQLGEFCAVITLVLMDQDLYVCRVIKEEAEELIPLKLWRPDMVLYDGDLRRIRFNIDSFATKIYSYDPSIGYSNDQTCELSFWGLLGSQARRVFETPCWVDVVPAVLLPVDQPYFVEADLYPFSHINLSPPLSDPVTGGNAANPQSRAAVKNETCCPADTSFPRKKKNSNWRTAKIPKIPRYLRTTAIVADKKERANVSSFKWNIYPNPTTDKITLEINSPDNLEAAIVLTDQQGRRVYTGNIRIATGINRQTISLKGLKLSAGMYIIRIRPVASEIITEKEQTRKIILQ